MDCCGLNMITAQLLGQNDGGGAPPAPTPPVNTVAPLISGLTAEGSLLTCTTGTWTGTAPITYAYQWKRGGVNIGGATNNTYTLALADSGANITCVVTATNVADPGGVTAGSNTIVAGNYSPVNTVAPVASGTNTLGQTLSTTNGTWTGSGIAYTYQWQRDGVNIGAATNNTYDIVTADLNKTIRCVVTATNTAGAPTANSNGILIVPAAPVATAASDFLDVSLSANWGAVTGATDYKIDVNTAADFSGTAILTNQSTGNVTTYSVTGLTANTTYYYRLRAVNAGGPSANSNVITATTWTAEAIAFLTVTAISDATIRGAVNTLVVGYLSAGIWTKRKAIYPFVGGTAATHKYNLKDPQNTDAAFRLSFFGGLTHSSTGVLPDGSTGYADSHFVVGTDAASNAGSMGYYSRTNSATVGTDIEIGGFGASFEAAIYLEEGGQRKWMWGGACTPVNSTNTQGWYYINRKTTTLQGWKNGTKERDETATAGASGKSNFLFASNANGSPNYYSFRECAFAVQGGVSLTDAEALAEYNLIQAFQTTLGRQV